MKRRSLPWFLALAIASAWTVRPAWAAPQQLPADPPQGTAAADAATQTARAVFEDPDFWWKHSQAVDAPTLTWFGKICAWLIEHVWDLIVKIFQWLFGLRLGIGNWSTGIPLLWVVVAVLGGWALWKLAPRIRQWWAVRNLPRNPTEALTVQEKLPEARVLLERARAAIGANQCSEALRFAFLALLAWLQERGILHYDPSRTNREYQHDLQQEPALAAAFGEVARPFERVWYGRYPADLPETERVVSLCRRLVEPEEGAA